MRSPFTLLLALIISHAAGNRLSAQEPELVPGAVSCAECAITLDTVVTIGGAKGPGLHVITLGSHIAVDRRGRILITESRQAEISVFDSTGSFLRTVGRRGEGPGEYQLISHIGVGRRYIHILERQEGRTMLDHDFEIVRTDRFPGQVLSAAVMEGDEVAFSVPAPGAVGHRLHILRPSGEILSFDGDGKVHPSQLDTRMSQTSTVAGKGNVVWAVRYNTNRIVRWDLAPHPRVSRFFDRHIAEFERGVPRQRLAPRSMNNAAMVDDRGLWIHWQAPDPAWKEPTGSGGDLPREPMRKVFDGWLDLVDPETGRTITRQRYDGVFLGFAEGSRYLVAYHETDAGVPFLHFLKPRLSRRSLDPGA